MRTDASVHTTRRGGLMFCSYLQVSGTPFEGNPLFRGGGGGNDQTTMLHAIESSKLIVLIRS
jgi:hypothetical protein